MSRYRDTIAALATPVGTAALAVIRISGPDTATLVTAMAGTLPPPRRARHLDYHALGTGELLDDVVLSFFPGPRSYTAEDAAEISCHGNPYIAQRILEDLLVRGCRPAEPGEFTQRAFLNGRIDLSQAEAVMDIIHARSERALAAAHQQLRGGLSRRLDPLVSELLGTLARIEAYIDFPDEDLPTEDVADLRRRISVMLLSINDLLATSHYGSILRDGIKTVILGPPNAGKSSLLNRLVGSERAIVSPEPGTTRDFLEERISIGPHLLRLIDTAGLNPSSPAPLEKLGMDKTMQRAAEADIFLLVLDASAPSPPRVLNELRAVTNTDSTILVFNKCDLAVRREPPPDLLRLPALWISALRGDGIDELRSAIVSKADAFARDPADLVTVNARHGVALAQARECFAAADAKLAAREPVELVASELRGVVDALGQITGRIDNERMLDQLFATFCIGK